MLKVHVYAKAIASLLAASSTVLCFVIVPAAKKQVARHMAVIYS